MQFNAAEPELNFPEISSIKEISLITFHFRLGQILRTRIEGSYILCQKKTRVSLKPVTNNCYTPQPLALALHRSDSALLSSRFLLDPLNSAYSLEPFLFLVQSPRVFYIPQKSHMVRSFTSWYQILCLGYSSIAMTKHPMKAEYPYSSTSAGSILLHTTSFPRSPFLVMPCACPQLMISLVNLSRFAFPQWPRLLLVLKILQLLLGLMCVFFEELIADMYIRISMIEVIRAVVSHSPYLRIGCGLPSPGL